MKRFFLEPFRDVLACLEHVVRVRSAWRALGPLCIAMLVTWFIYVPIHELLHAFGCVSTGGEVTVLEISPHYGAKLLQPIFPFVQSGSDYAGRLSGFDTHGSDFTYFVTVFMPFVLSVFIGVPLVKMCTTRRRPILFGIAIVVGLAPFYNIPGDYFEMGSILVTRFITLFAGGGNPPLFEGIRSDDIYLLLGTYVTKPGELGLTGVGRVALGGLLILISFTLDVLLAFGTYALGAVVGRAVIRQPRARVDGVSTR